VRYRGLERQKRLAQIRKVEAARRQRDLAVAPADLSDNDLWAAIYRLQHLERRPPVQARLEALTAEQRRRRQA
jgi:hypothetical protein